MSTARFVAFLVICTLLSSLFYFVAPQSQQKKGILEQEQRIEKLQEDKQQEEQIISSPRKNKQQSLSSSSSSSSSFSSSFPIVAKNLVNTKNITFNDQFLFRSKQVLNTDWFLFHERLTHHLPRSAAKKKNATATEKKTKKKKKNKQIPYARVEDVEPKDLLLVGDVEQELRREAPRLCKARWKHHRSRMFPSTSTTAAAARYSSSLDKCIDRVTEHYANWTRDRIPSPEIFVLSSVKDIVTRIPPEDNLIYNNYMRNLGRNDRASADLFSQFRFEFDADSTVRQVFEQLVNAYDFPRVYNAYGNPRRHARDFNFVNKNNNKNKKKTEKEEKEEKEQQQQLQQLQLKHTALGKMKKLLNISFRGPLYASLRLPNALATTDEKLVARLIASARRDRIEIFSNNKAKKLLSKEFLDLVEPAFCSICSEWQHSSFRFDYAESNLYDPEEKTSAALPNLFFVFGDGADDDEEDQNVEENKNRLLKHKLHSSYQKCKDPGARTRQCAHDVMTNTNAKKIVFFTLAVHQATRWLPFFKSDTERIRKGIRAQLNFLASRRNVWLYVFVRSQLDCITLRLSPNAHQLLKKNDCPAVNNLVSFIENYVHEYWKELQENVIGSPRRMLYFPTVRTEDVRRQLLQVTRSSKFSRSFFATREGIHLSGPIQAIHSNYLLKAVDSSIRCYSQSSFSSPSSSSASASVVDSSDEENDNSLFPEQCVDPFSDVTL